MLPLKPDKPIRYADRDRMPSPEMVQTFFNSFGVGEEKYKLLFSLELCTGLRIGECVAVNVIDFLHDDYFTGLQQKDIQKIRLDCKEMYKFMTELMKNDFTNFRVLLQKKQKENCIADMEVPIALASILKEYILSNLNWIMRMGGFIFCKNNNRQPLHISPTHAIDFLAKKRKVLHEQYPELGFMDVVGVVNYSKDHGWHNKRKQRLYKFSTHSFRKFHALNGYLFEGKDPIFAKQLLHHNKLQTTEQHYISHFDFKEKRKKFQNKIFGQAFHELIRKPDSQAIAVWHELKTLK